MESVDSVVKITGLFSLRNQNIVVCDDRLPCLKSMNINVYVYLSNHKLELICTMCLFLIVATVFPAVYAENPTPYLEWDFDLLEVEVRQDQNNLKNMIISIPVVYKGEMELGTVDIQALVTDPSGRESTVFGTIKHMEIGENRTLRMVYPMYLDGNYSIDLTMTPPEPPYLGHIFDSQTILFEVEKNGLEKNIGVVGTDSDNFTTYMLEDPNSVQYFEVVHAVINLPESHTYEKIAVTNGKFVRGYSIEKTDIYIKSDSSYNNMKVILVKEGNLLPLADAQDAFQDYVKFYVTDKDECHSIFCLNIDLVEDEEFPLWILIVPVGVVCALVVFLRRKKDPSKTNPQILSSDSVQAIYPKRVGRPIMLEDYAKDYGP